MKSTAKLEQYITEKEISQSRTAREFILWLEDKLAIIKEHREELNRQNILHEGIAKVFYEELLPLYRLLQNKLVDWGNIKFIPLLGNQNYDVELDTGRRDVPRYIEITVAGMNYKEHNRMEYFLKSGRVDLLGKVSSEGTKKTGKKIDVGKEGFIDEEQANQFMKDRIKDAINGKMEVVERPDHIALLVYFDDYTYFRYDKEASKCGMNNFLDSINITWYDKYAAFYVVGASGKSLYERYKKQSKCAK